MLGGSGGESNAGKTVTVDGALQLATVWACVRLISETVATLPLVVYARGRDNGRTVAADHPLYALLLHDSPSADHTAVEFIEGLVLSLCLWGNAYARKLFVGPRLVALEPMRADSMTVLRDEHGSLVYRYAGRLRTELAYAEEQQLLYGDGTGTNLLGLIPQATAYVPNTIPDFAPANALGSLIAAFGQLYTAMLPPSGIVLHPLDWLKMLALKDTTGQYLGNGPFGELARVVWNQPIVPACP